MNAKWRVYLKNSLETVLKNIIVLVLVFGGGYASYQVSLPWDNVSAVGFLAGLAVAMVLLYGYKVLPGVFLGYILYYVVTLLLSGFPGENLAVFSLAIGAVGGIQAFLTVYLIRKFIKDCCIFYSIASIFKFVSIAALGLLICPTIGMVSFVMVRPQMGEYFLPLWFTWWIGNIIGAVIVVPFLLSWSEFPIRNFFKRKRKLFELFMLLISILLVNGFIYFDGMGGVGTNYPLSYIVIPFVLWGALRFGQRGVTLVIFITAVNTVWDVMMEFGPFARVSMNEQLLLLQTCLALISLTGLVLSAALLSRKKTEVHIRSMEKNFRLALKEAAVTLFRTDKHLCYTWVYNSQLLPRREMIGKRDDEIFSPVNAGKVLQAKQQVLEKGKGIHKVVPFMFKGKLFYMDYIIEPVFDDEGNINGVAGTIYDISLLKKSEQERGRLVEDLEYKTREMENILRITSHDLRSPLLNVKGFSKELDLSLEEVKRLIVLAKTPENISTKLSEVLEKDIRESIQFINESANKMECLLEGLLKLSRAGRAELTIQQLDVRKIVDSIIKEIQYEIRKNNVQVEIGYLPECKGDELKISQVFSNLIGNALKYLDPGRRGNIKIWGQEEFQNVIYCVEDNGVGIPEDKLDKIFVLFYRARPDRNGGEGVGLSLVRRIIERHRGKIWVESTEGKGSKFWFSLPKGLEIPLP